MEEWGDQIEQYDLVVALSPTSKFHAEEYTKYSAVDVEAWDISDPTAIGVTRDEKLAAYRITRDQINEHIIRRFGSPIPA